MRLKPRKILFSALILFIFYVSYKILQPEFGGQNVQDLDIYDTSTDRNEQQYVQLNVSVKIRRSDVVKELKDKYRLDWEYKLTESPWSVAQRWMSKEHVHPEFTPELGE